MDMRSHFSLSTNGSIVMLRKLMASRGAFEDKNKGIISQDRGEDGRLLTGGQPSACYLPAPHSLPL